MSAPTKLPVNALDRSSQPLATRSIVQSVETSASQGHPADVPIGVVEIPVEVWGSRRVVSTSGQPGRIEIFSEETCTIIVFPQGAVIRLSTALGPGQLMMVTNRKSGQLVLCRVVSVRSYPNMRGYAEIEFMQPVKDFWGPYIPQGTANLTARIPLATPEKPTKARPDAPRTASSQAWILAPSATSPKPPAVASTPPENFLSSSFPKEVNSVLANAATASPALPLAVPNKAESIESRAIQNPCVEKPVQRAAMAATASESRFDATKRNVSETNPLVSLAIANSSELAVPSTQEHQRDESASEPSARSWIRGLSGSLLGQVITRTATDKTPSPRRRMVFVCVIVTSLFMMGSNWNFPSTSWHGAVCRNHSFVNSEYAGACNPKTIPVRSYRSCPSSRRQKAFQVLMVGSWLIYPHFSAAGKNAKLGAENSERKASRPILGSTSLGRSDWSRLATRSDCRRFEYQRRRDPRGSCGLPASRWSDESAAAPF